MLALPTPLDWRIRPRWDGLRAELASACCAPQPVAMRVHIGWRSFGIDVEDSATQWPAALLAGLGTPWNTLQLDGDLVLSTQGLSVEWAEGRLALAGRAELQAQRMSSRLSTLRPMGSYRITVTGGATPNLQLQTLEGSLQLSGSGQWVGARLHFNGEATAAPGREEQLANLLNIIGRRNGARSIISIG
jgi:general secretion pathway protein N